MYDDLNTDKANQLELSFVEIMNSKKAILSFVVFANIQLWMLLILKMTKFLPNILAKILK